MAATNYTPIQLYRTTTASAVPTAGNLAAGELAINLTDEKLYFKNASGTVTLLASSASASNVGTVTSVAASGGTTGLTFSGSPITSSGTLTLGGTLAVANGGTGATSLTSGYLVKGNGTSAASASVVYDDGTNVGIGTSSPQNGGAFGTVASIYGATSSALSIGNASRHYQWGIASSISNSLGLYDGTASAYRMVIDSSGNVGIGTSSPSVRLEVAGEAKVGTGGTGALNGVITINGSSNAAYGSVLVGQRNGSNTYAIGDTPAIIGSGAGLTNYVYGANPWIVYTNAAERMRIDSSGRFLVGSTSSSAAGITIANQYGGVSLDGGGGTYAQWGGNYGMYPRAIVGLGIASAASISFEVNGGTEAARITPAGYLEATYSDKVVALGNTGTAKTITLTDGNVFTATLTGNCTFTLSGANANSSRGSSFTLILTNDGTAGRTVAWAGGNFRFPGGASTLSRTTTANATDIWVFFTPDNGTTWYGNISMKDMKA